jgi:hypothetical protein
MSRVGTVTIAVPTIAVFLINRLLDIFFICFLSFKDSVSCRHAKQLPLTLRVSFGFDNQTIIPAIISITMPTAECFA